MNYYTKATMSEFIDKLRSHDPHGMHAIEDEQVRRIFLELSLGCIAQHDGGWPSLYTGLYYYYVVNDKTQAMQHLETVLELLKSLKCDVLIRQLGDFYRSIGDEERYLQYNFIAYELDNMESAYNIGMVYYKKEDTEAATHYLTIAANQQDTNAMRYLGYICRKKGDMNAAYRHHGRAWDLGDDSAIIDMVKLLVETGDHPKLRGFVDDIIDHRRQCNQLALGDAYCELGELDKAEECYNKVIQSNGYSKKDQTAAMDNIGWLYHLRGNYAVRDTYWMDVIRRGDFRRFADLERDLLKDRQKNIIELEDLYYHCDEREKWAEIICEFTTPLTFQHLERITKVDLMDVKCSPVLRALNSVLRNQVDLLKMHFKYAPGGNGFNKARRDYLLNEVVLARDNKRKLDERDERDGRDGNVEQS